MVFPTFLVLLGGALMAITVILACALKLALKVTGELDDSPIWKDTFTLTLLFVGVIVFLIGLGTQVLFGS